MKRTILPLSPAFVSASLTFVPFAQLLGRTKGTPAEALRKIQEAAAAGERGAHELIAFMEPRPSGYQTSLLAAAELGSVKAMRAAAKVVDPARAVDLLIAALSEEVPGSLQSRALLHLANAMKAQQNVTALLAILTEGEVRTS